MGASGEREYGGGKGKWNEKDSEIYYGVAVSYDTRLDSFGPLVIRHQDMPNAWIRNEKLTSDGNLVARNAS